MHARRLEARALIAALLLANAMLLAFGYQQASAQTGSSVAGAHAAAGTPASFEDSMRRIVSDYRMQSLECALVAHGLATDLAAGNMTRFRRVVKSTETMCRPRFG